MALFGKKKGASPDSSSPPVSEALTPVEISPAANGQNTQSPFDDLLNASPNAETVQPTSAFDFPTSSADTPGESTASALDFDDIFGIQPAQTPNTNSDPFAINAPAADAFPSAPVVSAPAPMVHPAPVAATESLVEHPAPEPGVIVHAAPKRKKSPLLPILGALGALALAGGAYVLTQGSGEDEIDAEAPVVLPRRQKPAIAPAPPVPGAISQNPRPASSTNAPMMNAGSTRPSSTKVVSTQTTTTASSTKAVALTPQLAAQLKTLWKAGADSKHRGDAARTSKNSAGAATHYAQARQIWTQALQIRPGHPGFQESIDKLPQ